MLGIWLEGGFIGLLAATAGLVVAWAIVNDRHPEQRFVPIKQVGLFLLDGACRLARERMGRFEAGCRTPSRAPR
jgi:hypothetical protein